jgi:hypothetical protein
VAVLEECTKQAAVVLEAIALVGIVRLVAEERQARLGLLQLLLVTPLQSEQVVLGVLVLAQQ